MAMSPAFSAILPMPTCRLGVVSSATTVTELMFLPPETALRPPTDALTQTIATDLVEYLKHPCAFTPVPLTITGTTFQRRVWAAIGQIPCGQVRRYGELALALASAPRAVGQACGANRFPLIIPCHRVLGRNGIGGFANHSDGWLIETKRWLLWHEGVLA
jgi:methylated-DNA-[protein]-cysteine S-methyltransferase